MKKPTSYHHLQTGFTAVETLLTIMVATMFIISLYLLYITITSTAANDRNRATANELAYAYLRKYASANSSPTWFVCDVTAGAGNTNDSTINSNATGQVLESGTLTSGYGSLPKPILYSVSGLAVYGCSGANINKPIRIQATVTYGPNSRTLTHSTFVEDSI